MNNFIFCFVVQINTSGTISPTHWNIVDHLSPLATGERFCILKDTNGDHFFLHKEPPFLITIIAYLSQKNYLFSMVLMLLYSPTAI